MTLADGDFFLIVPFVGEILRRGRRFDCWMAHDWHTVVDKDIPAIVEAFYKYVVRSISKNWIIDWYRIDYIIEK